MTTIGRLAGRFSAGLLALALLGAVTGEALAQNVGSQNRHTQRRAASPAEVKAQERAFRPRPGYMPNGPQSVARILLRQNRIDLKDRQALRELAQVFACEELKAAGRDDFAVRALETRLQGQFDAERRNYPMRIVMHDPVQIDSYDFERKGFTLRQPIKNLGTIGLFDSAPRMLCIKDSMTALPMSAEGLLEVPLTVETIPMAEADAQALLQRLEAAGTPRRLTMAMSFTTISSELSAEERGDTKKASLLLRLEHIDFFEDYWGEKLIFTFPPE